MSHASTLAPTKAPSSWSALAWKATLILIPLLTAAGLFVLRQAEVARLASHALPKDGLVPSFQLIDQNGAPFGSPQLLGKIWIADFVYSTCPGPCPMISSRMGELQKPLRDTDVKLVSFSVDPQHDTPAVLRNYAAKLDAQPGRWYFLTGDKDTIYRLSRDGFKLAAEEERRPVRFTAHDWFWWIEWNHPWLLRRDRRRRRHALAGRRSAFAARGAVIAPAAWSSHPVDDFRVTINPPG